MGIRRIIRKLIYGCKADSNSYIEYLRKKGYSIGNGCKIYAPMKTTIDEPGFMLEIGDDVRITEGVTILCHDASVYTLDIAKKCGGGITAHPVPLRRQSLATMFSLDVMLF